MHIPASADSARRKLFAVNRSSQAGWTLTELLIVVAILAILSIVFLLVNWKRNVSRANDARRKTDLANVRRAFEEYYNDNECYPDATILNNCGSTGTPTDPTPGLAPYMRVIPCDPATREPYLYQPDSATNLCSGNRVCAKLQDIYDPDIVAIGCDSSGCGWGPGWNYCLATGATITAPGFVPSYAPTSTPLPEPTINPEDHYACGPNGQCNYYDNPINHGCPSSFPLACPADPYCQTAENQCNN